MILENKNVFEDIKKKYDFILCDSLEAIEFYYKKGLSKKIIVITSSPAILNNAKIKSRNLFYDWSQEKYKYFQNSICDFTISVHKAVLALEEYSAEEAILASIWSNHFNKHLLKLAQLKKNYIKKKFLYIEIDNSIYQSEKINPFWNKLKKNFKITTISYKPLKFNFFKANNLDKIPLINRFILGGFETIFYRMILYLFRTFKVNIKRSILILSENELLIEIASKFFLKGYFPHDLRNIKIEKELNENVTKIFDNLFLNLNPIIVRRIEYFIEEAFMCDALDFYKSELLNIYKEYYQWRETFKKIKNTSSIKFKKGGMLFSNTPANARGMAAKNIFKKDKFRLFSFQHGVTPEISASHKYTLSSHDSSVADYYFTFNKKAAQIANRNPFSKSKVVICGAPKRYTRQSLMIVKSDISPILFLSNKLYKGNSGSISTYSTDLQMSQYEISLINLLEKINKKVTYKPYPESYPRYYEKDPCQKLLEKCKNILIFKYNYDARFITAFSQLIIGCTATSTVSWALLSNKPYVFINHKYNSPLKEDAYKAFKKGIFLFDYEDKVFSKKLISFLNQPFHDILNQWNEKRIHRINLIEKFISSNPKRDYLNEILY